MIRLNEADLLVGYNCVSFDTPVIESVTGYTINVDQYDILANIWGALGTKRKGFKLGEVTSRLGLGDKVVNGEGAPSLYRAQRFGKLFDYCINDVAITRTLANWIQFNGYILTPENEPLEVARPGTAC